LPRALFSDLLIVETLLRHFMTRAFGVLCGQKLLAEDEATVQSRIIEERAEAIDEVGCALCFYLFLIYLYLFSPAPFACLYP
jgi:hypothetical protein